MDTSHEVLFDDWTGFTTSLNPRLAFAADIISNIAVLALRFQVSTRTQDRPTVSYAG